jgi:hypothetical protein
MRALGSASSGLLDGGWYRDYSLQAECTMKTWMDWRGRSSKESNVRRPPVKTDSYECEARLVQDCSGSGIQLAVTKVDSVKKRWLKQRALALHPLGMVASSGSKVAAASALDGHAMHDCLSGKRVHWEAGAVTFESVDGTFMTAEFQDTSTDSHLKSSVSRTWIGSAPPSQSMWKRVKL